MANPHLPMPVTWSSPHGQGAALEVARRLGSPLRAPVASSEEDDPRPPGAVDLVLVATGRRLELHAEGGRLRAWSELVEGRTGHRGRTAGQARDLLLKAVGPPRSRDEVLLDATAGLGRDALALAAFGYRVVACERHPVVAELLADGLRRARAEPRAAAIAERIELVHDDAIAWLDRLGSDEAPAVIYVDPMHPRRRKAALVRQELQVLQRLLGPDRDGGALLAAARRRARRIAVVKSPPRAAPLLAEAPRRVCEGRRARFDVYGPAR